MSTATAPPCTENGLPDPGPLTAERLARIAKGLAHPARVGIVAGFRECRPHVVNEIVAAGTLAQSTVSDHLRILKEADLVFARPDGPRMWYCLRRSVLRELAEAVAEWPPGRGMGRGPRPLRTKVPAGCRRYMPCL